MSARRVGLPQTSRVVHGETAAEYTQLATDKYRAIAENCRKQGIGSG